MVIYTKARALFWAFTHMLISADLILGGQARHSFGPWEPLSNLAPLWLWGALHGAVAVGLALGTRTGSQSLRGALRASFVLYLTLASAFTYGGVVSGTSFTGAALCLGAAASAFLTHAQVRGEESHGR